MKYIPCNNRIIVKTIKNNFEKTGSGLLIDQEDLKTESKNNLIRVVITKVGKTCEFFKQENEGLVVLIHEVAGVPMHGVDSDYRVLREDDIWCYSKEDIEESINMIDVLQTSEFAKEVDKSTNS